METRLSEAEAKAALSGEERTDLSAELHCSLANAFRRNHSSADAEMIFETAFANGLLASKWQRFSFTGGFHVRGLASRPIWDVSETGKLDSSSGK